MKRLVGIACVCFACAGCGITTAPGSGASTTSPVSKFGIIELIAFNQVGADLNLYNESADAVKGVLGAGKGAVVGVYNTTAGAIKWLFGYKEPAAVLPPVVVTITPPVTP